MCKVYTFPVKKEIPKELEERLNEVAKEYVEVMADILELLCEGDEPTDKECEEFMEVILTSYVNVVNTVMDNREESE